MIVKIPQHLMSAAREYEKISSTIARLGVPSDMFSIAGKISAELAAQDRAIKGLSASSSIMSNSSELITRHERALRQVFKAAEALRSDGIARKLSSITAAGQLAEDFRRIHLMNDVIAKSFPKPQPMIDLRSIIPDSLAPIIEETSLKNESAKLTEEILSDVLFGEDTPEVSLNSEIIEVGGNTNEGQLVIAVSLPWFEIFAELEKDPAFLFRFVDNPRRFEEFIAGAYERDGWTVTLTPRSGDLGRDVIATKGGFGSLRFVDQCKAYKPGHKVTANDVRAILGVMGADRANKGLVTTTSEFAPGIEKDRLLKPYLGDLIELKDGTQVLSWLKSIVYGSVSFEEVDETD